MDGLSVPSHGLKLLVGSGNPALSEEIAGHLGVDPTKLTVNRFADGEIFVRIDENVRGNDVFILQPTNAPADNIMELLLLIDAARRASAARITCVMPYYGYSRQDRKDQPRVAIGAKLIANMIVMAGANRVLGLDFHQHQLQGFFDVPVDHLYAAPVFVSHYRKKHLNDLVVVAPDVGSAKMARGFAKRLNGSLAIIDKRRPKPNESEVVNVVGEVEGSDCLLTGDELLEVDVENLSLEGMSLNLADQGPGAGAVERELDHCAFGRDPVEQLLELAGVDGQRLRITAVAIDDRGYLALLAKRARRTLAGAATRRGRKLCSCHFLLPPETTVRKAS
jgi:ribose-phosphate pyrophosphokinase